MWMTYHPLAFVQVMMHRFGEILGGVVSHDSKDQIHNN
jgi:hypothetical protein